MSPCTAAILDEAFSASDTKFIGWFRYRYVHSGMSRRLSNKSMTPEDMQRSNGPLSWKPWLLLNPERQMFMYMQKVRIGMGLRCSLESIQTLPISTHHLTKRRLTVPLIGLKLIRETSAERMRYALELPYSYHVPRKTTLLEESQDIQYQRTG